MSNLFNYNKSIYPDRYDRSKNWVKILPVPGRNLQTAELIEMQSIQEDNLKQGFNSLFKNGTILSGLKMELVSLTESKATISISSGQMYIEGIIIEVSSTSIETPPFGLFNVGVLITEKVVTELEDPTLRDPIKGDYAYGTEGAARLVWTSSITINDSNSFVIGQVLDGSIVQTTPDPFYLVNQLLSTYTYERAGNFCVRGFDATAVSSSQRAVSDQKQYSTIQASYSKSQSDATASLSAAISAQTQLINLKSQLDTAISAYNSNPTPSNQIIVANLTDQVNTANSYYSETSTTAVTKQSILKASKDNLDKAQSLLVNKILISIAPGLAYVGGKRIETNSPTLITVEKNLPTSKVTNATFTYAGKKGLLTRLIQLTGASTFLEVKDSPTIFVLEFNNLVYDNAPIDITFKINVSEVTSNTISEFVDLILFEFNKTSDQAPSSYVTISGTVPLTSVQLRSIVKASVVITRTALNNLIFTSTSALNSANQINITSQFYTTNSSLDLLSASTLITTDVFSSNIYGASQNTNFQLGFTPVAEVIELVATLEELSHPVVRGLVPGTQDSIGASAVIGVKRVKQGTVTYVEGVDYNVIRQSELDWSLGGAEPAPGTSYYIDFLYSQALTKDKDFTFNSTTSEINFGGGLTPASDQQFSVTYSYYLAVAATIGLSPEGLFSTTLSNPSSDPTPPPLPSSLLPIASLQLYADRTVINSTQCRTVSFSDLFELEKEIQSNTANIQNLTLNSKAYNKAFKILGEDPIGMFNDVIQDVSKLDIDNPLFTASISPSVQGVTLGYTHKDVSLSCIPGGPTQGTMHRNCLGEEAFFTLFTNSEQEFINQKRATHSIPIPLPSQSLKRRGKMYVSTPILFNNKNLTGLTTCDSLSSNLSALSRLTNTTNSIAITNISKLVKSLFKSTSDQIINSFYKGNALSNVNGDDKTFLSKSIEVVFADNLPITIKVEGLTPNTDGYSVYFSGSIVPLSALTTLSGTPTSVSVPNAVRTNINGVIHVTFSIPEGISPGIHLIEVSGANGYAKSRISIYNNLLNQIVLGSVSNWGLLTNKISANEFLPLEYTDYTEDVQVLNSSSQYTAGPIPYQSSTVLNKSQEFPSTHSPINQIFSIPDYIFISSCTLKLKTLPVNGNIKVYLKECIDNLPTKTVYGVGEVIGAYLVSTNGSAETSFTFCNPVLLNPLKKYCLSVEADRPGFELFVSSVGKPDLIDGNIVGDQLYLDGSLVLSNNGINLDTQDNVKLSFKLNSLAFSSPVEETVELGAYGVPNGISQVSHFCVNSRDILIPDTSILYEYSTNSIDWIPFTPNIVVCLPTQEVLIYIRATMSSTHPGKSPVIGEGHSISLYSSSLISTAISTPVEYPEVYTNLDIVLQYVKPANTTINVQFSPTSGYSWEGPEWLSVPINPSTVRLVDPGLSLFEATFSLRNLNPFYTLSIPRTKFRYRINLSTADPALQPLVNQVISYVW